MSESSTLIRVYTVSKIQRDGWASLLMVGNLSFTLEKTLQKAPDTRTLRNFSKETDLCISMLFIFHTLAHICLVYTSRIPVMNGSSGPVSIMGDLWDVRQV